MKTNAKRPPRAKGRSGLPKKRRPRGTGPFSYTVQKAGAMIGLSRSASYRAVHLKQIPTIEVNGGWVVPRLIWDEMLGIKGAAKANSKIDSREEAEATA
jgi:hypothetical protein